MNTSIQRRPKIHKCKVVSWNISIHPLPNCSSHMGRSPNFSLVWPFSPPACLTISTASSKKFTKSSSKCCTLEVRNSLASLWIEIVKISNIQEAVKS